MRLEAAKTAAEKQVPVDIPPSVESKRSVGPLKSDGEDQRTQTRPTTDSKRDRWGWVLFAAIVLIPCLLIGLERELVDLNTRRTALLATVSVESPSLRILDRQISALEGQIQQQLERFGSGGENGAIRTRNLSDVVNEYSQLIVEQEFAEKAYTSALSSLETSQAEARREERYFAIVVEPTLPEVALYPKRILNTLLESDFNAARSATWLLNVAAFGASVDYLSVPLYDRLFATLGIPFQPEILRECLCACADNPATNRA
ncbi:MAG: hypothetical protein AAF724_20235 [Pseudomonadota bacterium]